jgi:hypothetical protein
MLPKPKPQNKTKDDDVEVIVVVAQNHNFIRISDGLIGSSIYDPVSNCYIVAGPKP